jgi:glycosyltransferase involved in cell wall biosynthesis
MSAPSVGDPCYDPAHRPVLPGGRVRVVELLATGTNGGAQEHVFGLLTRIDAARYDVGVISLSPGSGVRKLQRAGIQVTVIDEPDDAIATGAVAALLSDLRPEVVHNHMYRAELVGTRAAIALGEIGRPRPFVVSTVHSSRIRSEEDRAELRILTPRMDRLIAVSRSIVEKLQHEGRDTAPIELIHNGVDLQRYDHQGPCCTLREEYGLPAEGPIVGVVARLEPEKGHPTLLEAWPLVLAAVPDATLLVGATTSRP